ncbi:MAG: hypothetical protein H7Y86_21145 [Rhizobacter sp.]|nr:hypothetical protein [Ferruginibacter sp.]
MNNLEHYYFFRRWYYQVILNPHFRLHMPGMGALPDGNGLCGLWRWRAGMGRNTIQED